MIPQGRRLVPPSVVHQDFIQLSCPWSFFSCALLFCPLSFGYYRRPLCRSYGFLFHLGSCVVKHGHRLDQGSDGPYSVWNATYCYSFGCLVSSHRFWFVRIPIFNIGWIPQYLPRLSPRYSQPILTSALLCLVRICLRLRLRHNQPCIHFFTTLSLYVVIMRCF